MMSEPSVRILITGWRGWDRPDLIEQALFMAVRYLKERLSASNLDVVVVHGGAAGADLLASRIAKQLGYRREIHRAENFGDWPECGARRNSHMVELGADLCLAFPSEESRGTVDCLQKAWRAGMPVWIFPYPET